MASNDLQWFDIKDFTPGIRQVVTPNQPPGAADPNGTWGCVVADGGVLRASPKRQQGFTKTNPVAPGTLETEQFRITGLHCLSPVANNGGAGTQETGYDANESEVWLMYEYSVAGTRTTKLDRLARYVTPVRWENIWTSTTVTPYFNVTRPRNCFFMTGRSNNAEVGTPGYPVIGWNANDHAAYFPDDTVAGSPTNATINLPQNLDAFAAPVGCVSHQGRAVIFPLKFYNHGLNATNATNEQFHWTEVNNWRAMDAVFTVGPPAFTAASVSYDDTGGGFQLWASMTANELLLGKARGGGVVVRGDLNNFQVVNLPNFMSCGYSLNVGCKSPLGWVYPVDSGTVWLWAGGDRCQNVSTYMEPNFWRPTDSIPANTPTGRAPYGFAATQMSPWGKYVLTPNNWAFDTNYNSWWRFEDPTLSTLNYWRMATDATQRWMYASPSGWKDNTTPVVYEYDAKKPGETYHWQSHPLEGSKDRHITVREIILVASCDPAGALAASTITVTVTSDQDITGQTCVYNLTNASYTPHAHRSDAGFGVAGTNVRVSVVALCGTTGIPAPRIHELRIGYADQQRLGRTNTGDA